MILLPGIASIREKKKKKISLQCSFKKKKRKEKNKITPPKPQNLYENFAFIPIRICSVWFERKQSLICQHFLIKTKKRN